VDPAVSVLLPFRDAAGTLAAALRSVARQSLTDFECILVDDGSTDESRAIARAVAAQDQRFRVVPTKGGGLVAALQQGLTHCRATLVARMDADDLMHSERLQLQGRALREDPTLTGIGTHVHMFPAAATTDGMRAYESWLCSIHDARHVAREALVECPLAHPTWMVRTDALRTLGYREGNWPEDYELLLRSLGRGDRWSVVPRRLHAWRRDSSSLSQQDPRYAIERFTETKAAHLAATFLRDGRDYTLWGHGGTGRALRAALERHGLRPGHIVELHPGRIGQRIHGARVVHVDALDTIPRGRLVVSVSGPANRAVIRAQLDGRGWRESIDYVCAA
jgi:glycosyltransferase involved in cell wall biosynthesis